MHNYKINNKNQKKRGSNIATRDDNDIGSAWSKATVVGIV